MKFYKSVVASVERENYKKGVNRLDTGSGYYKTSKKLNILSSIWLMVFQFGLIFANTTALLIYTKNAQNVDMPLYIATCIAFVILPVSIFLIKKKWHIPALVLNLVAVFVQLTRIYYNDTETTNNFLNDGYINNPKFWMYFVPGILVCLFTLIICLIGIKTYIHFRKDYKAALAKMFESYKEENPAVSDIEWTEHLEELDKNLNSAKEKKEED